MRTTIAFTTLLGAVALGIFSFSQFNEATISTEIENIEAYMIDDVAFLTWTSSSEVIGDEYIIEKSPDGKQFETLKVVDQNGLGSKYTYVDESPNYGLSYYRVRHKASSEDVTPLINHGGPFDFNVKADSKGLVLRSINAKPDSYLVTISDKNGRHIAMHSININEVDVITIPTEGIDFSKEEYLVSLHNTEWSVAKEITI
ncbi:MAG: hypothetical protein RJQ09_00740 [Cyclobacteriaceae bacterium]